MLILQLKPAELVLVQSLLVLKLDVLMESVLLVMLDVKLVLPLLIIV